MIGYGPRPPTSMAAQRQDRELDELESVRHQIEQQDLVAVDDIFRIVQRDRLEADPRAFLLPQHGAPGYVQAIGLRRRFVPFVDAQDQPNVLRGPGPSEIPRRPAPGMEPA